MHQNMKLRPSGTRLDKLSDVSIDGETPENLDYKVLLSKIHCEVPTENCHLQTCSSCPGPESCRPLLESIFRERMVEKVEFKQWTTTDRSNLNYCGADYQ